MGGIFYLFPGGTAQSKVKKPANQTASSRQVTTTTEDMSANQVEAVVCNVDDLKSGE